MKCRRAPALSHTPAHSEPQISVASFPHPLPSMRPHSLRTLVLHLLCLPCALLGFGFSPSCCPSQSLLSVNMLHHVLEADSNNNNGGTQTFPKLTNTEGTGREYHVKTALFTRTPISYQEHLLHHSPLL